VSDGIDDVCGRTGDEPRNDNHMKTGAAVAEDRSSRLTSAKSVCLKYTIVLAITLSVAK